MANGHGEKLTRLQERAIKIVLYYDFGSAEVCCVDCWIA
jgi:hypothetical protein